MLAKTIRPPRSDCAGSEAAAAPGHPELLATPNANISSEQQAMFEGFSYANSVSLAVSDSQKHALGMEADGAMADDRSASPPDELALGQCAEEQGKGHLSHGAGGSLGN